MNQRKNIIWIIWMAGILLVALIGGMGWKSARAEQTPPPLPAGTALPVITPAPMAGSLVFGEHQIQPLQPIIGQEALVGIKLTGAANVETCWGAPGKPLDAMLVFDISTSAGMGPGSNWERTAALAGALLTHLSRPVLEAPQATPQNSRLGLVSSLTGTKGPEPVLLQTLTDDYNLLRSQLNIMTPSGDTDIAAGLRLAADELSKFPTERTRAIILMLHDNGVIKPSALDAAKEVQSKGVPIYLVINSVNIAKEEQITAKIAGQIAPAKQVYQDPDARQLYNLFIQASQGNNTLAGMALFTERFNPAESVQLTRVTDGSGSLQANRVVWKVNVEQGKSVDLKYSLIPAGKFQIQSTLIWIDCNGYLQQIQDRASVDYQVAFPDALTPTPILSTVTPLPSTAELIPTLPSDDGTGWLKRWNIGIPWLMQWPILSDWLWLLFLILLFLFLLWLLWRFLRRETHSSIPSPIQSPPVRESQQVRIVLPTQVIERPGWTSDWQIEKDKKDRAGKPVHLARRREEILSSLPDTLPDGTQIFPKELLQIRANEPDGINIGEADLVIEVLKHVAPLGVETTEKRAYLKFVRISGKKNRGRGVEVLMLELLEAETRRCQINQLVATQVGDEDARLFESRGFLPISADQSTWVKNLEGS